MVAAVAAVVVAAQLVVALAQVLASVPHLQCRYLLLKLVQSSKEMMKERLLLLLIQKILRKKIAKLQKR